ncbi:Pls/PosA family non-ribosomal peptide synthetase [Actinocrispum sp. NPDC049592]|uniref:Pls/PosA family non-ribosomal peptide synthetase n=1 Tax=Actinocrispum sp. NPDC049592 TaxID=3154835 RepID=UPI003426CA6F
MLDPASRSSVLFSGGSTPPERTLVDILSATARQHPNAPALDDGTAVLTYRQLMAEVEARRDILAGEGVGIGDRVGIRVESGTAELYLSILAVLAVGAAYVPVDADDPDERAELVWAEAGVCMVIGSQGELRPLGPPMRCGVGPSADGDAWIIFTSGSTGTPKGVAVSHRSAAAFVDAEARLFLQEEPMGPGDRVLAGLSVAFDASCEEMWLAWRHGACLVPAPRALVRTGMDLGPWLLQKEITIVSTVPTLAALWPVEALDEVRLLIFGGEACPPELAERLAVEGREVWNTYGPTEATVVACAAQMTGEGPVRIGLPLDGWDLAVVDPQGNPVPMGETGELVIGGVGLARYLDAEKDAQKFAPLESLGWERAYRSGDIVKAEPEGLLFVGRGDEQVKLGGRRIELGEVDAALQALPGVAGAAAAVKKSKAGNQVLVGYVVAAEDLLAESSIGTAFDEAAALEQLRAALPAALVPLLAVVDTLPTRTSGKVDRAALPWPLTTVSSELSGTAGWLAELWTEVLGIGVDNLNEDFFARGGSSLGAAQLVSLVRRRYPGLSVSDVYQNSKLGQLVKRIDELADAQTTSRTIEPMPRLAALTQTALMVPLLTLAGLRWMVALAAINNIFAFGPAISWWLVGLGWLLFVSPAGRLGLAAGTARLLLKGLKPGTYKRGSGVHLRLWTAERVAAMTGVSNLSGAPWITYYAKALGAKIGKDADLHSLPPITGMLKLGKGAAVEPEVDLTGYWMDGDLLHIGKIRIGASATIGARSTLLPGARVGKRAEVAPGSAVMGAVRPGQRWAGAPAVRSGKPHRSWPSAKAPRKLRWALTYGLTSLVMGLFPILGAVPGLLILADAVPRGFTSVLWAVPLATVTAMAGFALLILLSVRLLGIGLRAGHHPVHSRIGWQAWATERLMDLSRILLFPMYSSLFTAVWLRLLGAKVGRRVEASTVLAIPKMTTIGDGAFLADDTMVATYELSGGWVRVGEARVGKRAFLGNSGMTAPGRAVPNGGLVGVLSEAPKRAKAGSSYLGMPPMKLRRTANDADSSRTFEPPKHLVWARALVEICRVIPVMASVALAVLVLGGFEALASRFGFAVAALLSGAVLFGAGLIASAVTTVAKWVLVGRFKAVEHPLWSSFVWRNELADTFVEVLAGPWLVSPSLGTPVLTTWLRTMGARIGKGVYLDTYWLPEADLVSLGDGVSVNRGCVLQTHLFHDRIMSMSEVIMDDGSTLGPHGIVLPGAKIGARTTIGPASLVMRGEGVPADTRWLGNPISAWTRR